MRSPSPFCALAIATAAALAITAPSRASAQAAGPAITQDDFLIRTTADLAKLCDADARDPMHSAAVQFCLGFGVGVHQNEQLHQAASRARPLYCLPNPAPSRVAVMTGFIAWTKATPSVATIAPAAGVMQYFMQAYPCPPATRR